ncbi:uncharacterized protein LOC135221342 [Macrobrachium nipponense]|uniref:uncharacterized protein LOC135221342 n=1 Tax=Macrobrachium nipponense TaxID=159736 RepID=UPI0030C812C1
MCRLQLGWDEEMPANELQQWKNLIEQLPRLANFKLARNYTPASFGKVKSYKLHHSSDASQSGYGTTTYLRIVNEAGEVHCTLMMARARVAPLKRSTIPRLELTAAIVAAHMNCKLQEELDIPLEDSVFWTDSTSVLKYLLNEEA